MKLKTTDAGATTILSKESSRTGSSGLAEEHLLPMGEKNRVRWFWLFVGALTLTFAMQLWHLTCFAMDSELDSYLILIPFICLYLVFVKHKDTITPESSKTEPRNVASSPALAAIPLALGLVMLTRWWNGATLPETDGLSLVTLSFVCFVWAGGLLILGAKLLRPYFFAMGFLIFLVPLPMLARHGIEIFFQRTSAEAASLLFTASGTTVLREGLLFHLPGITLRVAEECSGIRSSLILFITSLLAGKLFLRSPSRRLILTLFVVPLAIARNGFRIFTIAMLCVHVDPSMIDAWIHKRGGPVFFGLSLIPFFLLLVWLRHTERSKSPVVIGSKQQADKAQADAA